MRRASPIACCDALAQPYSIQGREVHSTASIGIVTSDHCLEGAETIIRNADVAMYEAKRAGRACSVFFNDAMHTRLYAQPDHRDQPAQGAGHRAAVAGVPADRRAGHRQARLGRGADPLATSDARVRSRRREFVPVAEESGLIVPMGEWVMQESCAALARWQQHGPGQGAARASASMCRARSWRWARACSTRVRESLAAAGLPPREPAAGSHRARSDARSGRRRWR